jgi:hypothetical protein
MPSWRSTESWRVPLRRIGWSAADEWSRSFNAVVKLGPVYTGNELQLLLEPGEDFDSAKGFCVLLDSIDEAVCAV